MTADVVLSASEESTRPPTQLADFRERCEDVAGRALPTATALHSFSVECYRDFWRQFLDWSGLVWDGADTPVCTDDDVRLARFFPHVRLNYAENLLRPLADAGDASPALTSVHADGSTEHFTRGELRRAVQRASAALGALGVGVGERVVAIAPNNAAVVVAALAVSALGATLSTATPDMGPSALLGRFGQVRPTVLLLYRDGTARNGASPDEALGTLLAGLPQVEQVVLLDDAPLPAVPGRHVVRLDDLVTAPPGDLPTPEWPRLAFDHPLWTMFSSGTTGPPKAIVHGAGGALLEHVKEHRLHGDLRAGDRLYFHTTTAWMMWNWQLSALAVGAHIVVYDGPVTGPETLWELVARQRVTVFGTSPAYLQMCQDEGYRPREAVDLPDLRAVLSTGAVLHDWQFDWLADAVGPVPVQSISGGTDIIGCFVLGHPEMPVQPGRCQSLGLGLDVAALDKAGDPVVSGPGELVCRRPFPSRPVGFLDDEDGSRFHESYFSQHPGVWTHGDVIEIAADGSARMFGRSDGVLNIDGVRIGPSEIYTIVRRLPEVAGALAVEQHDPRVRGATRLVLLVVLQPGAVLDDALAQRIRSVLRREGSAAHVPSVVLAVPELPTTHNGKFSEQAARDALHGVTPRNLAALRNPDSLTAITAAALAAQTSPVEGDGADPEDHVLAVVARHFRGVLGVPVADTAHFFDSGGTSRQSMTLLRRLRVELGRPVSMDLFLADPTIRGLSASLASRDAGASGVEQLRAGRGAPLVLVHGAHGDVDLYRVLAERLETAAPVIGLTAHMGTGEGVGPASVTELAERHVRTLLELQPEGPVRLMGYSFGGLVAFDMARRLADLGRTVEFLGLLDVRPPLAELSRNHQRAHHLGALLARMVPGAAPGTVREFFRPTWPDGVPPADDQVLMRSEALYDRYRWGRYDGPVTYFRCRRRIPVLSSQLYAWRRVVRRLTVVDVPGAHHDVLAAEHSDVLSARVSAALRGR